MCAESCSGKRLGLACAGAAVVGLFVAFSVHELSCGGGTDAADMHGYVVAAAGPDAGGKISGPKSPAKIAGRGSAGEGRRAKVRHSADIRRGAANLGF